jgi:hypothetical protein
MIRERLNMLAASVGSPHRINSTRVVPDREIRAVDNRVDALQIVRLGIVTDPGHPLSGGRINPARSCGLAEWADNPGLTRLEPPQSATGLCRPDVVVDSLQLSPKCSRTPARLGRPSGRSLHLRACSSSFSCLIRKAESGRLQSGG